MPQVYDCLISKSKNWVNIRKLFSSLHYDSTMDSACALQREKSLQWEAPTPQYRFVPSHCNQQKAHGATETQHIQN